MEIAFAPRRLPESGTVAVTVLPETGLSPSAQALDATAGGALSRALAAAPRFKAKAGAVLDVLAPAGLDNPRVLLLGLGAAPDASAYETAGGELVAQLNALGETRAAVVLDAPPDSPLPVADQAAHLAFGARLRGYRFDKYKTRQKPEAQPTLETLAIHGEAGEESAAAAFAPLDAVAAGVALARDLVSEPANVLTPAALAAVCEDLAPLGLAVEVLEPEALKARGLGALLAVGQGSANPPRLVTLRWDGGDPDTAPLAVVGKGVCFDSGGLSIKPASGMEDMKWDMGGAAVTIGLMKALAGRQAKANVVGVVGLVENMPSGSAYRPGDIVTSMSGQTIEVLNTDAEGRLVLADAIAYTQETVRPAAIVDLATLTGAVIVALGKTTAGLFANDDALGEALSAAGSAVGERLWRLPLGEDWDRDLDSEVADMKNVGEGRTAGAIIAAQFIQRFVLDEVPWAHLDIAGVTWAKSDAPTVPKGGTGFGVRLLDRLVRDRYET